MSDSLWARMRDPISGLTHLAGAVLALAGWWLFLVDPRHSPHLALALNLYGASLVFLFSASATYHFVRGSPGTISRLRKLDHTAIYLLIAGTYTPLCLHFFRGFYQSGLLAIVWSIALIGIAVKWLFAHTPRWLNTGIYLVMSWIAVIALREMFATMPRGALLWLFFGGVFFTVGAGVYVTKKPDFLPGFFGFHEIWHLFVLLGCFCHFIVVAAYIAPVP